MNTHATPKLEPGSAKKKSSFREYAEALLTAVLIAFFLRTFVVEPFKIPSGSMIPTLMVGDHIFVSKFSYGLRLPFTKKWLTKFGEPKRGEVIVFIYPEDEKLDFIKRVVGVPGDKIRLEDNDVYVNGEKLATAPLAVQKDSLDERAVRVESDSDLPDASKFQEIPVFPQWEQYQFFLERLGEHTHLKQEGPYNFFTNQEIEVPPGKLFVMGDNRDNSRDSREWGFVPMENVKGRAKFIWLSLRYGEGKGFQGFRWDRFGKKIL